MVDNNLNPAVTGDTSNLLIPSLVALSGIPATFSAPNRVTGTPGDDNLQGTLQSDLIDGGAGDDIIDGFLGNDLLIGGNGDDILTGNAGNDILEGGSGADIFRFDTSAFGEGHDLIRSFDVEDRLEFDLGNLLVTDPGLASSVSVTGDFPLGALDELAAFSVRPSADGFVVINHPNGSIEIEGLVYSANSNSFADLRNFITITDHRPAGSQILTGQNEVAETINGGSGDDMLFGGTGPDTFVFNPNNLSEGHDVIIDFDPTEDRIAFDVANLLAADAGLAAASPGGNNQQVELADLDASTSFFLFPTADNSVGIAHPNGTIELDGVRFNSDTDSFSELGNIIELQHVLDQPTPEQEAINGFISEIPPEPGILPRFTGPSAVSPSEAREPFATTTAGEVAIGTTGAGGAAFDTSAGQAASGLLPDFTASNPALADMDATAAANQMSASF